jgi:hypothetical protein
MVLPRGVLEFADGNAHEGREVYDNALAEHFVEAQRKVRGEKGQGQKHR